MHFCKLGLSPLFVLLLSAVFARFSGAEAPEGPQVAAQTSGVKDLNVLVIVIDPVLKTRNNQKLHEYMLWSDPYMQWDELHWKIPGDKIPHQTDNPWFYRPYDIPDVGRSIWIMGFSYERGEGEALEDFCHRIESVMSLTVGRGVWDTKKNPDNVWNRFTRIDKTHPGESEVGSCHEAPNSADGYDWDNPKEVWTYAMEIRKPHCGGVQSVQVGCLDMGTAVTTQVAMPHVVHHDDEHIRVRRDLCVDRPARAGNPTRYSEHQGQHTHATDFTHFSA